MPDSRCRLRQICLAAPDLAKAEKTLANLLQIEPAFHDPAIKKYGLQNVVFPVNGSFLEIVAPMKSGTAVERFLARGAHAGGYLIGFDSSDMRACADTATSLGVNIVVEEYSGANQYIQLHPRDMGGTLVHIDQQNMDSRRFGDYPWCGADWQASVRTDSVVDISGVCMASENYREQAQLWASVLEKPISFAPSGEAILELDYGWIAFGPPKSSNRDSFEFVEISVHSPEEVLEKATVMGLIVDERSFVFCGLQFCVTAVK